MALCCGKAQFEIKICDGNKKRERERVREEWEKPNI